MIVAGSRLPSAPIEPPGIAVAFPDPRALPADEEIVAVSRRLSPAVVLAAYRKGIFPWPYSERLVPWVSPSRRAILPLESPLRWPRSVHRARQHDPFTVTFDRAFRGVILGCRERRPGGTWITPSVVRTYAELHDLGWAHSVEVWTADGSLAGGLYGVALGAMFAAESMFHRCTNASKVAFAVVAERLRAEGFRLFDVQVLSDHLAWLGCQELPRERFLDRLEEALAIEVVFPAY